MNISLDSIFWAGTEQSLAAFNLEVDKFASMSAETYASVQASYASSGEDTTPRLFNLVGNVGVISITGALVNNDSWINAYLGRTGYGEIRDALVHAANDPTVGAILLDIRSGGGAVSGVSDTSALISKIDKELKPVHTFSDGQIASAAYWIGSAARTVSVGDVTEAGSIGVMTVHSEQSKARETNGIKDTVIKAGEFKALGNPYEPLSAKAQAQIQAQLDHMYGLFVQSVADNRGVSYQVADTKMAQGKVFVGSQAVDVGLADAVSTFDAVISKLQGGIDAKKSPSQYGANFAKGSPMKVALTEQQISALAKAGLKVNATAGEQTALTEQQIAALAELGLVVTATEEETAEQKAAKQKAIDEAAAAAAATEAAKKTAANESPEVLAFVKTALAEAQAENTKLTIELRDAKLASEAMTKSHTAMRAIAVASVDRLKVALGGTAGAADAMADEALLAEHAVLRAQFESKFKVGGVAAVSSTAETAPKDAATDAMRQARIKSTQIA